MYRVRRGWEGPARRGASGRAWRGWVVAVSWVLVQAADGHGQTIIGLGEQRVLHVLGETITVKIDGTQTGGKAAVIEEVSPVKGGPPLHVHRDEDEVLYVLEGEVELQLGEQRVRARAGSTAFLPRDVPHAFRNVGTRPSRVLVVISPAQLVGFFDAVHALTTPTPDQVRELGKKYGLTFLPPDNGG